MLARPGFAAAASAILRIGHGVVLHVRGHRTSGGALHTLVAALVPTAREAGARLVVNDRVDVARATGADGVQLGVRSLSVADVRRLWPAAWIGASVHGAQKVPAGTDFILLGTIYPTASHADSTGNGIGILRSAVAGRTVPVVAIGGIGAGQVASLAATGADGVAVIRAVWDQPDPGAAAATLLEQWNAARRGTGP